MSNQFEQIKRDIMNAMRSNKPRTSAYDTTAEVLYVEGETAWVRIPGGAPETPVDLSVAAKQGDIVQVRVANGRAWINGNNTAPPTDNTVANAAHTVATEAHEAVEELEEHFWYDGSGAHVESAKGGTRTDLRSDGMHVIDLATGTELAGFGTETTIRTADGTELAHFGYGEGVSQGGQSVAPYYTLGVRQETASEFSPLQSYNGGSRVMHNGKLYICIVPEGIPAGAWNDSDWQYSIGNYSFAEGYYSTASGVASHAENYGKATGNNSHAEGVGNAFGEYSHAEGGSQAWADYSHSEGIGVIAGSRWQHVTGMYNAIDEDETYGIILGNGDNENSRSNAIGVTWDGDYEFQADGDLATALTAKGWNVAGTGGLVSLKKILTNIINAL